MIVFKGTNIRRVSNTKGEALASAELISKAAKDEMVISMPNDTVFFGLKDGAACIVLKLGIDTPIVQWTANGNMNSKATVIKKRSNQRSMNIEIF